MALALFALAQPAAGAGSPAPTGAPTASPAPSPSGSPAATPNPSPAPNPTRAPTPPPPVLSVSPASVRAGEPVTITVSSVGGTVDLYAAADGEQPHVVDSGRGRPGDPPPAFVQRPLRSTTYYVQHRDPSATAHSGRSSGDRVQVQPAPAPSGGQAVPQPASCARYTATAPGYVIRGDTATTTVTVAGIRSDSRLVPLGGPALEFTPGKVEVLDSDDQAASSYAFSYTPADTATVTTAWSDTCSVAAAGGAQRFGSTPALTTRVVDGTPTAQRFGCGAPDMVSLQATPTAVRPGQPVRVSVSIRTRPCYPTEDAPHVFTVEGAFAGVSGQTDEHGQAEVVLRPMSTTRLTLRSDGRDNPQVTRVTIQVTPDPCSVRYPVTLEQSTIQATGVARVSAHAPPGTDLRLLAYTRPSTTFRQVRTGVTDRDGTVLLFVRPPANTRLLAVPVTDGCSAQPDLTGSVVLNVATTLTLTAQRLGTRDYVFAGDSLPARPGGLIVSLYRRTDGGHEVLTAQARAGVTDGEWSLRRHVTGSGRFGFLARTGQDLRNAPGASNVRSTLVF